MSKLKKALIKLSPLSIMAIPVVANAKFEVKALLGKTGSDFFGTNLGRIDILISRVIQILLIVAAVVALIYLIVGGYQYITAGGNAEQAQAARTTLLNAIVGLIVIFASYAVLIFIINRFLNIGG